MPTTPYDNRMLFHGTCKYLDSVTNGVVFPTDRINELKEVWHLLLLHSITYLRKFPLCPCKILFIALVILGSIDSEILDPKKRSASPGHTATELEAMTSTLIV